MDTDMLHELDSFDPLALILSPKAGSVINRVHMEAIRIAATLSINVEYTFNGKRYRVDSKDLYGLAKEVKA